MSICVKQDTNNKLEFFSINKLQQETKNICKNNNLSKCYFCHQSIKVDDRIDFYSDGMNEYCKHYDCQEVIISKRFIFR